MTIDRRDEKDDGKKSKLSAGLTKMSFEDLTRLHRALTAELERRAKTAAHNKKPSQMTDAESARWIAREIQKAEGKDQSDE